MKKKNISRVFFSRARYSEPPTLPNNNVALVCSAIYFFSRLSSLVKKMGWVIFDPLSQHIKSQTPGSWCAPALSQENILQHLSNVSLSIDETLGVELKKKERTLANIKFWVFKTQSALEFIFIQFVETVTFLWTYLCWWKHAMLAPPTHTGGTLLRNNLWSKKMRGKKQEDENDRVKNWSEKKWQCPKG